MIRVSSAKRPSDIPEVWPGLTGLAQIHGSRDVPRRHKFKYDLIYIQNQSFWLDLKLIALSFWIMFRGNGNVGLRSSAD